MSETRPEPAAVVVKAAPSKLEVLTAVTALAVTSPPSSETSLACAVATSETVPEEPSASRNASIAPIVLLGPGTDAAGDEVVRWTGRSRPFVRHLPTITEPTGRPSRPGRRWRAPRRRCR